jgi:hypothetical protein
MRIGKIARLEFTVTRSAVLGSVLLWIAFTAMGIVLFQSSLRFAIVAGFGLMLMHWLAVFLHQAGHAVAARQTGYPMVGIKLWGVLSSSVYPADEPELPASVHIKRALGGPIASLIVAILAGFVATVLFQQGNRWWWVAFILFVDNLMVFTIGALLPLGFTDGSTLLRNWKR